MQRILPFPIIKTSWGKNLEEVPTSSELISELRKDFYLIFSLELCLNTIFLGKNYATRPLAPENHENRNGIFSSRIFPKTCMDLPDGGEVLSAYSVCVRLGVHVLCLGRLGTLSTLG